MTLFSNLQYYVALRGSLEMAVFVHLAKKYKYVYQIDVLSIHTMDHMFSNNNGTKRRKDYRVSFPSHSIFKRKMNSSVYLILHL